VLLCAVMWRWMLVSVLVLAVAAPAVADPKVVCLGDSLTEGYEVSGREAFPALVAERLQARGWPDIEVVNAGVSGSTSASAVSRLRWQLRGDPDVVVLALGANDGLRGIDTEATKKNLAEAIDIARTENVIVLLAGMKMPPNYGSDYTKAFEGLFDELAREKDVALIPFLLDGVAARAELNLADGIHPNPDGYSVIADTVIEHLLPLLRALPAGNGG
jgi:acyl-CoA thioesterase-1